MDLGKSVPEAVLGKSSSWDSKGLCRALSWSNSQPRPDIPCKEKKASHLGHDLFVSFPPRASINLVPRPILSPGRERGWESSRRTRGQLNRSFSGPVFSLSRLEKAGKKQSNEVEEPLSPKVTCIGQVRLKQKNGKAWESVLHNMRSLPTYKKRRAKVQAGSASSERSFPSPNRQLKRGLLFGSRRVPNPPACSNLGTDFSCFCSSCSSHLKAPACKDGKSSGTVFAKSLILIQEIEERLQLKGDPALKQLDFEDNSEDSLDGQEFRLRIVETQVHNSESIPETKSLARVDTAVDAEFETPLSEGGHAEMEGSKSKAAVCLTMPPAAVNRSLKRTGPAPPQNGLKNGGIGKNTKLGNEVSWQLETDPKHCEAGSLGEEAADYAEVRCLPRMVNNKHIPQRLDAISEETARQSGDESVICEGPQAETAEKEDGQMAPPPPSPTAGSQRRWEPGALEVSLDVVPETWLRKSCTIAQGCHQQDSFFQRGDEKHDKLHGSDLLDAELEAALWRSCDAAKNLEDFEDSASHENRNAEDTICLDADLEGSLWRICEFPREGRENMLIHRDPTKGSLFLKMRELTCTMKIDAHIQRSKRGLGAFLRTLKRKDTCEKKVDVLILRRLRSPLKSSKETQGKSE